MQALTMIDRALTLASLGLRVLPLFEIRADGSCGCGQSTCDNAGKHPRLTRWQERASTDAHTVRQWWKRAPDSGIGIATGKASGVWVLDIDPRHDGDESLAELEDTHGELETVVVHTGGGGRHLYFSCTNGDDVRNRTGVAPGIDVRGEGGYVVAVGSPHISGRSYEADTENSGPPAGAPGWLAQLVSSSDTGFKSGDRSGAVADRAIDENRNDVLMRLGAGMRAKGWSSEAILAALSHENKAHCVPPLSGAEVAKVAASVAKYSQGPAGGAEGVKAHAFQLAGEWVKERAMPVILHLDERALALQLIAQLAEGSGGIVPVYSEGEVYGYDEDSGTWRVVREETMHRLVSEYSGQPTLSHHNKKGEPVTKPLKVSWRLCCGVVSLTRTALSKPRFFTEARVMGFTAINGFVALDAESKTAKLIDHHHGQRSRYAVGITYSEGSSYIDGELFTQYIHSIFAGDGCEEEKRQLLQDYCGAMLVPGLVCKLQRCLTLVGEGANGKSVLIDLLRQVFPAHVVGRVPMQMLGNEYYTAALSGKAVNLVGDAPDGDVARSEIFKSVVCGEGVLARHPGGKPFELQCQAAHLFACNELPGASDMSRGYWRRFMVLEFNRTFEQGEEGTIVGLSDLIADKELQHVVAWMIEGALRLWARGDYEIPPSSAAAHSAWRHEADSCSQWVVGKTQPVLLTPTGGMDELVAAYWSVSGDLYKDYSDWCMDTGHRRVSVTKFGRRLRQLKVGKYRNGTFSYYALKLLAFGDKPFDWESHARRQS